MLDEDEMPTPVPIPPRFTRARIGSVLEVAGGAVVSLAAFTHSTFTGLLALGGSLIVFGVATELGGR